MITYLCLDCGGSDYQGLDVHGRCSTCGSDGLVLVSIPVLPVVVTERQVNLNVVN